MKGSEVKCLKNYKTIVLGKVWNIIGKTITPYGMAILP